MFFFPLVLLKYTVQRVFGLSVDELPSWAFFNSLYSNYSPYLTTYTVDQLLPPTQTDMSAILSLFLYTVSLFLYISLFIYLSFYISLFLHISSLSAHRLLFSLSIPLFPCTFIYCSVRKKFRKKEWK